MIPAWRYQVCSYETHPNRENKGTKFVPNGVHGIGKTTLGPLLARGLHLPFYDLDQQIESETGATIGQLFCQRGESGFRLLEAETLRGIATDAVVALGGGAFMTESVRKFIAKRGRSVFIDWPFSVLWGRVAGDPSRPLAQDTKRLEDLLLMRRPVYETADLIWRSVSPHGESAVEMAAQILAMLEPGEGSQTREAGEHR